MNDNFYIAVSARAALKDGKRKYFLGRLTCEKDKPRMSWQVQERDELQNEDSLSERQQGNMGFFFFQQKIL